MCLELRDVQMGGLVKWCIIMIYYEWILSMILVYLLLFLSLVFYCPLLLYMRHVNWQ